MNICALLDLVLIYISRETVRPIFKSKRKLITGNNKSFKAASNRTKTSTEPPTKILTLFYRNVEINCCNNQEFALFFNIVTDKLLSSNLAYLFVYISVPKTKTYNVTFQNSIRLCKVNGFRNIQRGQFSTAAILTVFHIILVYW